MRADLPELPPARYPQGADGPEWYTKAQMHAYARVAIAAAESSALRALRDAPESRVSLSGEILVERCKEVAGQRVRLVVVEGE